MITAPQLRAARGLLDWTRNDLAKAAGISSETVKNIEHGTFRPQETTAEAIVKAFAVNDVQFTENEGVQVRRDTVKTFTGSDGFRHFIDDVYVMAKQPFSAVGGDKPIYISNVDDRLFAKHMGDYFTQHIRRMNELQNFKMRILVQDRPHTILPEESKAGGYREYRQYPDQGAGNVPFYVYGDKLAILIFEEGQELQIVVMSSVAVAKAYRGQFEVIWNLAKPLGRG